MNEEYFLLVNSQQEGPFTLKQVQDRWRTRQGINKDTFFWQEGMDEWIPISTILDLLSPPAHNPYASGAHSKPKPESDKRILPAFILWFFLGSVGGHRFYIGRVGSGALLAGFSIIGSVFVFSGAEFLSLIGAVLLFAVGVRLTIDLITIVTGSMTDGDERRIDKWT